MVGWLFGSFVVLLLIGTPIAASLGLAPSECIVVEDAPSGIRAAHAAGIEVIGLSTSFSADYLREQAQPDYLLPDLKSILTML